MLRQSIAAVPIMGHAEQQEQWLIYVYKVLVAAITWEHVEVTKSFMVAIRCDIINNILHFIFLIFI